ncbi:hypothetical protein [Chromobacterium amazonense]|uniref:hypothetical protein n=1 Tax=Chromobacterium amazonense TaxID=1382803 RepID=UPI0021B78FBA|nr:hypothetical protein [Chromobacterium amazonense]MBM2884393.1 hypothetical protein [Chromobacterium amazonense]MDE1711275.1 hypothetical protein [Chromobacterium amazonense]
MQNLFTSPRQQQIYQLSILCPSMSLGVARREIRSQAQKHGLRIQQWLEQPQPARQGASHTLAPWLISADFRCGSETCMHFLQSVAQRLATLPLTRVKLDCLSASTPAMGRHANR